MSSYQDNKALILEYYRELEAADAHTVGSVINTYTSDDYRWYGVYPFNEQSGGDAVAEAFWKPFLAAWQGVQRRQMVFMAGTSEIDDTGWVISMGQFIGLLDADWLGIPATGKLASLRYADFNCITGGKITRSGFFCDIIDVMQQAGVNPLPVSTGATSFWPAPRTQDGLLFDAHEPAEGVATLALIDRMIDDHSELNKSGDDSCPPEWLARSWHDDMAWYGPAGIGATYTIPRYQQQHQHPFRVGLKDKVFNGHECRLAEGNYGGFFGWPNLTHTPVGGFLGLPGNDLRVDMRVVDIYRREGDKLAENWVLIDLPWWLKQQGLDVFERMSAIRVELKSA